MTNYSHIKLKTRTITLSLLLVTGSFSIKAQSKAGGNAVSFGINLPVGDFSNTHFIGISADYSPARHVFGVKHKHFAFTYNGGIAYYFGKDETVSSNPYHYPGYFFIHGFGGLLYKPVKRTSIILYAGPALGIYNGRTQFNIGSKLDFNYYLNNKIAIGPAIILMKEQGADPLWSASVKATLVL